MLSRCRSFIFVLSTLPLAIALAGCEPGTFYTEVKGETTLQGDPSPISNLLGAFPAIGSFTNMDFNANQDFVNQGVTKDQVSSVKVTSFVLKITSPSSQDFSFLDSLSFYAKVGDQEALVAEKTNIAALGLSAPNPTLTLDVQDAELQPYVTAPAMSLVVRGTGRVPPQNTTLEATANFRIDVSLIDL